MFKPEHRFFSDTSWSIYLCELIHVYSVVLAVCALRLRCIMVVTEYVSHLHPEGAGRVNIFGSSDNNMECNGDSLSVAVPSKVKSC